MLRLFSFLLICCYCSLLPSSSAATQGGPDNQVEWTAISSHHDADLDTKAVAVAQNGDLFVTKFDAQSSDELCSKIKQLHASFLATSPLKSPPREQMRPVYATAEVVNCAFRKWLGDPNYTACQFNQHEAIFATPAQCMRSPTAPLRNPLMINFKRLHKRDEKCVYTVVKCLADNFFSETEDDLIQKLQKQGWDQPYFAPEKLFARKEVVEKAWIKWNKVRLNGVEGVRCASGTICGKPTNEVGVEEGSYFAVFAQDADCAQGKVKAPTAAPSAYGAYGGGTGACRTINVECV